MFKCLNSTFDAKAKMDTVTLPKISSYLLEKCKEYKSDGGLDSTVTPLVSQ